DPRRRPRGRRRGARAIRRSLHPRRGAQVRRRLTVGLALLRVTGMAAVVLLLWNPVTARLDPGDAPPLVLLDASLSMSGHGGRWREALDSARALAKGGGRGGGGVIWRFGSSVRAYDTLPPGDGATRLAPALAAAAGRGGPLSIVTDGAIDDGVDVPPDLLRRARIVQLPRPPFPLLSSPALHAPAGRPSKCGWRVLPATPSRATTPVCSCWR